MSAPGAPPRRRWRRRGLLLRGAVTGLLLAGLFWLLPRETILAALGRMPAGLWLLVGLGFLAGHALSACKWWGLLRACGVRPTLRSVLRAHAAGLGANLFLPSLVGGDLVRAGLASRAGGGLEAVAVATVADRGVDTAALLLLIAAATPLLPPAAGASAWHLLLVIAALFTFAVLLGLGALLLTEKLPSKLRAPARRVRTALGALARRPGHAAVAVLMAVAVQGGFVLLNLEIGAAVGLDLPAAAWFVVWPLAKLAALVPVSLGGIGVREVALAALVASFGVAPGLAVGQALVWETVLVAGGLLAGTLALWLPAAPVERG